MKSSSNKRPHYFRPLVLVLVLGLFIPGLKSPWASSRSASLILAAFISPTTAVSVDTSPDLEAVDLESGGNAIELARISMRVNNSYGIKYDVTSSNGNVLMSRGQRGPAYTLNIDKAPSRTAQESVVILKMDLQPMPNHAKIKTSSTYSDTLVFSISVL